MSFERPLSNVPAPKERRLPPRIPQPPRASTRPLTNGARIPAPGPEFASDPKRDDLIRRMGDAEARKHTPQASKPRAYRTLRHPLDHDFHPDPSVAEELADRQNRELFDNVTHFGGGTREDRQALRRAFATTQADKNWVQASDENWERAVRAAHRSDIRDTLVDDLRPTLVDDLRPTLVDDLRSTAPLNDSRDTADYQVGVLGTIIPELDDVVKGRAEVRRALGASEVFQVPSPKEPGNHETAPPVIDQETVIRKTNIFPEGRDRPFDLPRRNQLGALESGYKAAQEKARRAQSLINFFDGLIEQKHSVNPASMSLLDRIKLGAMNAYHAVFKHQDARQASRFFEGYVQDRLMDDGYRDPAPINRAVQQASPAVLEQARLLAAEAFEAATEEAASLKERMDVLEDEIRVSERTPEEALRAQIAAKRKRVDAAYFREGQASIADNEAYEDGDAPLNEERMEKTLLAAGWNPAEARFDTAAAVDLEQRRRAGRPKYGDLSDFRKAMRDAENDLAQTLQGQPYALSDEVKRRGPNYSDRAAWDVPENLPKPVPYQLPPNVERAAAPKAGHGNLEDAFGSATMKRAEDYLEKFIRDRTRRNRAMQLLSQHLYDVKSVRILVKAHGEIQHLLQLKNPSQIDFARLSAAVNGVMDQVPGMSTLLPDERFDLATAIATVLYSQKREERSHTQSSEGNVA